ncbi:zinc finger protein [Plasmopara halstedii]|uniref:Zinc finger protein n=1 Tax=Plasmopara halstedii TaxID=4781 RepID=A0A0P1B690_PLAHL|nr:zinc finger protein [Plasmopara halstedii]CEG49989.1 zinc finger protein [Plasmopara halstedii]|eukprot:XP_024586358.1 zinc finger protein [Plasmopara halstedii]
MAASFPQAAKTSFYALVSCCFQPPHTFEHTDAFTNTMQKRHQRHVISSGNALTSAILSNHQSPPRWVKDEFVEACMHCNVEFDLLKRKHHCRGCGLVYCDRCTSTFDRVVKFEFMEPVRLCTTCATMAKIENVFHEKYLPLLEDGDLFKKNGVLRKKHVFLQYVRAKNIFQYQKLNIETRACEGDIKAILLDEITDVREVDGNQDESNLGVILVVGSQEHKFDATTAIKKKQWIEAIASALRVRNAILATEREKRSEQLEIENEEIRKVSGILQLTEERRAIFHEDRMLRRAVIREQLRVKYNLATAAS